MAMDLGSKGSVKADINVTPLVDVMLVLLIIMMLVAPLVRQGAPLTLPEANNSTGKPETEDQTIVSIDSRSKFYVNSIQVTPDDLVPGVQRALEDKKEKLVYLKGDKDVNYSAIMDVMDALRQVQIENIALIIERRPDQSGQTAAGAR